jgi:hypothetical protein
VRSAGSSARVALLVAAAVALFALPAFSELQGIASTDEFRNNDWLNCRSFDVLSRRALLADGELPLRTHLLGGGFPLVIHPSDGTWSPTILAVLLFGDVVGVKVNLLLFLFAGAWGTWLLARRWLELEATPALYAALLFAFSGWLPSMWLVGFYNQVFYLLTPLILYLLVSSPGRPERLVGAGALLLLVLQQGGHAFAAVGYFLAVCTWLLVASRQGEPGHDEAGALRRFGPPLLLLLLVTAPMAFARGLGAAWPLAVGWTLAVAVAAGWPRLRHFLRALLPWAGRLALVLVVASTLGAVRLVGLSMLADDGRYDHELQRGDALWFADPRSPMDEERFYDSIGGFLEGLSGRVSSAAEYEITWGREGDPQDAEYAWLGLTPVPILLAAVGLVAGWRRRRLGMVVAAAVLFTLICFGWRAPPDLHFLFTWGVPTLHAFSQPIKYWNFFILLTAVLLAGFGLQVALARLSERARRAAVVVAFVLLAWPFLQNRSALGELFELPRPAPEQEEFHQMLMVGESWWLEVDLETIRAMSNDLYLRDYTRPRSATEYYNIRRGVGTIDWYGSVVMTEEAAEPAVFTTLDGDEIASSGFRGEARVHGGQGRIDEVEVGHNRIRLIADLAEDSTVVVNQNWLPGFTSTAGEVYPMDGLLAIDLPRGRHEVSLLYRPAGLIAALATSLGAAVVWAVVAGVLVVRRRRRGSAT